MLTSGTIIANIRPQPSGLGLAVARRQHRNRRVVGMSLSHEYIAAQCFDQRFTRRLDAPTQSASVEPSRSTPWRGIDRVLACKGRWSQYFAVRTCASSPGPAMPRSIGQTALAPARSHRMPLQLSFGRT